VVQIKPEGSSAAQPAEATAATEEAPTPMVSDGTPKKKKKKRCNVCNAKVGMLGFSCRCEGLFCTKHRFPDDHTCSFDHKTFDRAHLAAANEKIEAEKLNRL
jgi:predicted nucleic acid binding AN1-type Zn finger protein